MDSTTIEGSERPDPAGAHQQPEIRATWSEFRKTSSFGSLDALRAISIILVIIGHAVMEYDARIARLRLGITGVTLFFLISGFLITTLLLREQDRFGKIHLKNFYVRRCLRIFPVYYLVVFLYLGLSFVLPGNPPYAPEFLHHLKYFLTYTYNYLIDYGQTNRLFQISWSLCAEEQFYVVWPVLVYLFFPYRKKLFALAGLLSLALMAKYGIFAKIGLPKIITVVFGNMPIAILLGVSLALVLHQERSYTILARFWRPFIPGVLLLVFLIASFAKTGTELIPMCVGFALLASCVMSENHVLTQPFQAKILTWTGKISYGIYLYHMFVYFLLKWAFDAIWVRMPMLMILPLYAISFAIAWVSFHYYENYFLRLKNRFKMV